MLVCPHQSGVSEHCGGGIAHSSAFLLLFIIVAIINIAIVIIIYNSKVIFSGSFKLIFLMIKTSFRNTGLINYWQEYRQNNQLHYLEKTLTFQIQPFPILLLALIH